MIFRNRCRSLLGAFLLTLTAVSLVPAQVISDTADDTVLRQVIIFGRHGVRSAALPSSTLAAFATRQYPDFGVPTGYLTPHGRQAETLLGDYFHDYLLHERLLTGVATEDAKRSYFRANSIQRSNISAAALWSGLLPGATVQVHSYPLGTPDPVFDPIAGKIVSVDAARVETELHGLFNNGAALGAAYTPERTLIRSVLFDYPNGLEPPPPTPTGLTDPTALPIPLTVNTTGLATSNVINGGGLATTLYAADPFVMEYTDGLPLSDVAWGQLSLDQLSQQTRVITGFFQLEMLQPYLNQLQSSNAVAHILRSMEQYVINDRIPGAFGNPKTRLVVVNSSDAYVVGVAGLLNAHWLLPGYQPDYCPPGGSLVFELRQVRGSGDFIVRVYFTAQTFDQLRNLTTLTLDVPPATMQLLVPGASKSESSLDIKFEDFQKLVRKAIKLQYVQNPSEEKPPAVLTGVPLS